jgi:hypothetical protein
MLNIQTPDTTTTSRFIVTRPAEHSGEGTWVLVADMKAGSESDRAWMQADQVVKDRHYRVCHFASKDEAVLAVSDCVARWGFGFVKTEPRAVELEQTTHLEFRTFDVVEFFAATGVK